jgi:hypothetical protein
VAPFQYLEQGIELLIDLFVLVLGLLNARKDAGQTRQANSAQRRYFHGRIVEKETGESGKASDEGGEEKELSHRLPPER